MSELAPVCLFTFNRLDETRRTISALQANFLSEATELYIFCDGADFTSRSVQEVREYVRSIDGFRSVRIFESNKNKGLAQSIIDGVNRVMEDHEYVVVLEDDLLTAPNFLDFMNQALTLYRDNQKIFSVTGWSLPLPSLDSVDQDAYFHTRMSSWGWGIWRDRWMEIRWDRDLFKEFPHTLKEYFRLRRGGSDLPSMMKDYVTGKNNSWAIRACYHLAMNDLLVVSPTKSKVNNIGFGGTATHTKRSNRFDQPLDFSHQRAFQLPAQALLNRRLVNEFRSAYSFRSRIFARINHYFSTFKP